MTERVDLDDFAGEGRATLFETPHTVRLALSAGEGIPAHRHPDSDIVLHLLSGGIDLHLDDERLSLDPGEVVRFDGDREISPQAREDSEALLVLT